MKTIGRFQIKDLPVQQFQDSVLNCVNPLLQQPFVDGVVTDTLALTTSFQNLSHKLGRVPRGWVVVAPDADATIWQDPVAANNPDTGKFVRLRASAAVNCKLWVF